MDLCLIFFALCCGVGAAAGMAVALFLALERVLPPWAAALLLSAAFMSAAAILLLRLRGRDPYDPSRTVRSSIDPSIDPSIDAGERAGTDPRARQNDVEYILGQALDGERLGPAGLVAVSLVAGLLAGRDRSRRGARQRPRKR